MLSETLIERRYETARESYARLGVDTEAALRALKTVRLSLHCWQGDDVAGFETPDSELAGGGLAVTGNYPGRARNAQELREDLETVLSLLPGRHRVNLHAIYGEFGGARVDRDGVAPEHFAGWIDWAREHGLGLDFNGTFFNHPKADDGFTLAHPDKAVRAFWLDHARACRAIGAEMGKALGGPAVVNVWIPDGYKDVPVDRAAPRHRLCESLDALFAEAYDRAHLLDSVECKLFGIGSEAYVVGSHEFYLAYAVKKNILLCLDSGHFHPTEVVSDKLSSVLEFLPEVLLHVSRGVRWDSDHVVLLTDEVRAIAQEVVRLEALERIHIGLDFFDASINRIAAWTIGARAMQKALLQAFLEPATLLRTAEAEGDYAGRLALLEEAKALPWGAVWDYLCAQEEVPPAETWLERVRAYEREVLSRR